MKKITSCAASLALALSVSLTLPTPVLAQDSTQDRIAECKEFHEAYDLTLGQCIAGYLAPQPAATCVLLKHWGFLEAFGFSSVGDCIRQLRD